MERGLCCETRAVGRTGWGVGERDVTFLVLSCTSCSTGEDLTSRASCSREITFTPIFEYGFINGSSKENAHSNHTHYYHSDRRAGTGTGGAAKQNVRVEVAIR